MIKKLILPLLVIFITGCGGGGGGTNPLPIQTLDDNNSVPKIKATPKTISNIYSNYEFLVDANDSDGDTLRYSIKNRPDWANFDTKTGLFSGIPMHEGNFTNIIISVTDEHNNTSSLEPFSIEVQPALNIAHLFAKATQPPANDYYYYQAPQKAIDANLTTYNHTQCEAPNNWLQLELPQETIVHKVVLYNVDGQAYRLRGATLHLRNENYTGVENVDGNTSIATLTSDMVQTIEPNPLTPNHYLLILGNPEGTNSCLHLKEVEVYGETPATPKFLEHKSEYLIALNAQKGFKVGSFVGEDFQQDPLSYSVDNPHFIIDSGGVLSVNDTLETGSYTLHISVSDGVNTTTTTVVVNVTSSNAIETALRTGSVRDVTAIELLDATRQEIATLKKGEESLLNVYDDEIVYTPTQNSQIFHLNGDFHQVYPFLVGNGGKNLAVAGIKNQSRFVAFGSLVIPHFIDGKNLGYEGAIKNTLLWLVGGLPLDESLADKNKSVAIAFSYDTDKTQQWLQDSYPQWSVKVCDDIATLSQCLSGVDLVVLGANSADENVATLQENLEDIASQGVPLFYMHKDWGVNATAQMVAKFLNYSLPYGGNWWAKDKANWSDMQQMQIAIFESLDLTNIDTMLSHFQNKDYHFDWNQCHNSDGELGSEYDECENVVGLSSEFLDGAKKTRAIFQELDKKAHNIFLEENSYHLYKLLALLGDKYREKITFPMDKVTTDDTTFMQSYYSDFSVYNYRTLAPVQKDMGNFSRSDFSTITPTTQTVQITSKQPFRATGLYALPGESVRVTREDNASVEVKVFVNSLRSGSTHEFEVNGYKRPKYLQSTHIPIESGKSIVFTSVYGGPLELEFDTSDENVSLRFENVGQHPFWAFWQSEEQNNLFSTQLDEDKYDWAELVTPSFEVHSTVVKMKQSIANPKYQTPQDLADATMKYTSNYPLVLAGFQGEGIDVVDEIHDFAQEHNLSIASYTQVKHMNADQASCGYGCSGNPYDAYWAFDAIGHGDIHEIGHGLQKYRFQFEGFENHAATNYYSYYTKSRYFDNTNGGDNECGGQPFKGVFETLQKSVAETNTTEYLQTNLWADAGLGEKYVLAIEAMMIAQNMSKLQNGWHLIARLHLLERAIPTVKADWDNLKANIGFSNYTIDEFDTMRANDWLVISYSFATQLNLTTYFDMMGIPYSQKARKQVESFNFDSVDTNYYISTDTGYCTKDDYGYLLGDRKFLEIDGSSEYPY